MIDFIAGQQQRGEEHPDQHLFGPAEREADGRRRDEFENGVDGQTGDGRAEIALPFRFLEKRLQISGR